MKKYNQLHIFDKLTLNELEELGYNKYDIRNLLILKKLKRVSIDSFEVINKEITINYFLDLLQAFQLKEAYEILDIILEKHHKQEYKNLIMNLVKLDFINFDKNFSNVVNLVNNFTVSNIHNMALMYLDLYRFLKTKPKSMNYQRLKVYQNLINSLIELGYIDLDDKCDKFLSIKNKLDSKRKLFLEDKDLTIIDNLNINQYLYSLNYIKMQRNINILSFSDDNNTKLILRPQIAYVDKECKTKADKAYLNNNYEESLRYYKELLKLKNIKPLIIARIGLCYLHLKDYKKATIYFKIATNMKYSKYDFTDTILNINTAKINEDLEIKPYVAMKEEDFNPDNKLKQKINNYEEIINTFNNTNYSINEVCAIYNLNEEQIFYLKLQMVRDYYANCDYEIGDKLLNSLNSSIDNELIQNIRNGKKFYKARIELKRNLKLTGVKK